MPPSAEQNLAIRERSRRAVLEAAIAEFGENGYHEASVADVAARAGVAPGTVGYHFGGKEQLVGAVLDALFAEFLAPVRTPGDADARLAALIDHALGAALAAMPEQRIVLALSIQPTTNRVFAEAEDRNAYIVVAFEDALRAIFRERGAADPALEEVMLRSVLEGVIVKLAIYGENYPIQAARRWLFGIYGLPVPTAPLPGAEDAAEILLRVRTDDPVAIPAEGGGLR